MIPLPSWEELGEGDIYVLDGVRGRKAFYPAGGRE